MDDMPATIEAPVRQSSELLHWMRLVGAGVTRARFAGFDAAGRFLVTLAPEARTLPALSTIGLAAGDVGRDVVIAFEDGDRHRPVILGGLEHRAPTETGLAAVRIDGDKLVLQAEREIELRCGQASIVLTRAGKVLIHGSYVLSRSRGANRIKGAHVDIN